MLPRFIRRALIGVAALLGAMSFASANIVIHIDKTKQRMTVIVDDVRQHTWRVSTGTRDHDTPNGEYRALLMKESHFSKEWDDAPMPHSIFFTDRGHAIHGSFHTRRLGRAASHGCVRLAPRNAEKLFALVKEKGLSKTKVIVAGNLAKRK